MEKIFTFKEAEFIAKEAFELAQIEIQDCILDLKEDLKSKLFELNDPFSNGADTLVNKDIKTAFLVGGIRHISNINDEADKMKITDDDMKTILRYLKIKNEEIEEEK